MRYSSTIAAQRRMTREVEMALGKENEAFDLINEKQARSQETEEPSRESKVKGNAQNWGARGKLTMFKYIFSNLFNRVGPP